MSASTGNTGADQALPSLATVDLSADPHLITVAARSGTDVELRIHTSIAAFAAQQWFPAVVGFAVTVLVHTLDAETARPRYLPPAEPAEWARAIFSTAGASRGYFLGAVDPNTGGHRDGQADPDLRNHTSQQEFLLEHAIVADFARVRAWRGDRHGNLVFRDSARNFNPLAAMCGRVTIADVEELVEPGELDPNQIHIPGVFVR